MYVLGNLANNRQLNHKIDNLPNVENEPWQAAWDIVMRNVAELAVGGVRISIVHA